MEQMLLKLARQLDALDEASLSSLWEKYAQKVVAFEPTQRWQEAALVLSFIQAKLWKNQLFNMNWAARTRLADMTNALAPNSMDETERAVDMILDSLEPQKKAQVIEFQPSALRQLKEADEAPQGDDGKDS